MAQHVKLHIVLTEDQVPFPEHTSVSQPSATLVPGNPMPLLISSVISDTHMTHIMHTGKASYT